MMHEPFNVEDLRGNITFYALWLLWSFGWDVMYFQSLE